MIGILDERECLELLPTATVGRVGFVRESRIEIIPVNYLLSGQDVIFRTREDGILAELPAEPDVAFEVDSLDTLAGSAWSVLLSGSVQELPAEEVAEVPGVARVQPWVGGERTLWFRFAADRISGRRVQRKRNG